MKGRAIRWAAAPMIAGWACIIYAWLVRPAMSRDALVPTVLGLVGGALILGGLAMILFARGESRSRRIFGAVGMFVGGALMGVAALLFFFWGLCTLFAAGFSQDHIHPWRYALRTSAILLPAPLVALTLGVIVMHLSGRSGEAKGGGDG